MMHRPSGMLADLLKDYPSMSKLDGFWVQGAVPLMHGRPLCGRYRRLGRQSS